ncbi:hypothetical protein ALC60_07542, partial [Trachymyrmex zeteki]
DDLVPVRCWLRVHYTKMTRNNEARCIHCDGKFIIYIKNFANIHKHMVDAHPEKLTEEEKNEVKLHWTWDYYIAKSNTEATCELCKVTVKSKNITALKHHLRRNHEKIHYTFYMLNCFTQVFGKRTSRQIKRRREVKFHWTWDYFTLKGDTKATCKECNKIIKYTNTTQLKAHLEKIHIGTPHNLIPICRWMRKHYTKLTRNNKARCNHCNGKFSICVSHLHTLHQHLVEAHSDKLAEKEKNEVKFYWTWDYFTAKGDREATCNLCKARIRYANTSSLTKHLKGIHKVIDPSSHNEINNESISDCDVDANKDIAIRKTKVKKLHLTQQTYLTMKAANNLILVRLWTHGHITILYMYQVLRHPDKLAEEEKNEVKFYWTWDYYIVESNTGATCRLCKVTVRYNIASHLKMHLKTHHE